MKSNQLPLRITLLVMLMLNLTTLSNQLRAATGACNGQTITLPFTDVISSNIFFCAMAEAYFSGLTNGSSATTYSPSANVPREQMAAFVTRTLDQSLRRGSRRAALNKWWSPKSYAVMFAAGFLPQIHRVQSDGADLWVSSQDSLRRFRASDAVEQPGYLLPAGVQGRGVLVAGFQVFVVGYIPPGTLPGKLYSVIPNAPGPPTISEFTTTSPLPVLLDGIAFDGEQLWIGSQAGAIARVNNNGGPRTTTLVTGFSAPRNVIYDGTNIWASDFGTDKVYKVDATGAVLQTVTVGNNPLTMAFDGTNLWVPNYGSNSVSVVRAGSGTVIATLTGNGLETPSAVAFDGERILITNENAHSVSVFRASDLAPLATVATTGNSPVGACSDGIHFWITAIQTDAGTGHLLRY